MVIERLNEKENDEDFDEDLYCLELQKKFEWPAFDPRNPSRKYSES